MNNRIKGIWLRTDDVPENQKRPDTDPADQPQLLRVLIQLEGEKEWRIAIQYKVEPTGMLISHHVPGHALDDRPIDPITSK